MPQPQPRRRSTMIDEPSAKKAKHAGGRPTNAELLSKSAPKDDAAEQRSIALMFGGGRATRQ